VVEREMDYALIDFKNLSKSKLYLILASGFFLLLIASFMGYLQPLGNIMWNGEGRYYIYSSYIAYWSVIPYGLVIIPALLLLTIEVLFIYLKHKGYSFAISSILFFITFLTYLYWFLHLPPDWSIEDTGFSIEMLVDFEFLLGFGFIMINLSIFFFELGMFITKDTRKPAKGLSICILMSTIIVLIFFIWNISNPISHTSFGLGWEVLIREVNEFLIITCVLNLLALLSEILPDSAAK
jgi:hypothetical protein